MKKIAVLISNTGSGTNLQAIIDAIQQKKLKAQLMIVVSDTKDAGGVRRAKDYSIPVAVCEKKDDLLSILQPNNYSSSEGAKRPSREVKGNSSRLASLARTVKYNVDYICLCGWKQIIPDAFIDAFPNKILNLHPGLIPDTIDSVVKNPDGSNGLWNKGKLTNVAIQNFLNEHAAYAGSSVHFLTHEFDFGPVLGRTFEKIEPDDTVETLYQRLKKKENQLYVKVLEKLCN